MTASQLSTAAMAMALVAALTGCGDQKARRHSGETAANGQAPATEPKAEPTPPPRSIMQPSIEPEPSPKQQPLAPITETIHFAGGGAELDDAAKMVLDKLIANPTTASGGAIVLRGSSDSGGSDDDNLIISRKRSEAVAAYLEKRGIAPDRVTVIALGEGRPVAPNVNLDGSDNPEGRARNRRVDIAVSPGGSPAAADESRGNGTDAGEPAPAAK